MLRKLIFLLPLLSFPLPAKANSDCAPDNHAANCFRSGLRIEKPIRNTIFERIGLQKGDVLLQVNGHNLEEGNLSAFQDLRGLGQGLKIRFLRPGSPSLSGEFEINLESDSGTLGGRPTPREMLSRSAGDRLPGRTISGGDRNDIITGLIEGLGGKVITENTTRGEIGVIEVPDRPVRGGTRPEAPSTPDVPDAPDAPTGDDGNPTEPEAPKSPDMPETPIAPEEPSDDSPSDDVGDDDDGDSGSSDDGDSPTPDPDDDFMPGMPDDGGNLDDSGIGRRNANPFHKVIRSKQGPWINPSRGPSSFTNPLTLDRLNTGVPGSMDRVRVEKPSFDSKIPRINPSRGSLHSGGSSR